MGEKVLKSSVPMALMDALPVLCFLGTVMIIGFGLHSFVFMLGAVLCLLAGLGKVLWKLVAAIWRKDVPLLRKHFAKGMLGGLVLMLLGVVLKFNSIPFARLIHDLRTFPVWLCLLVGAVGMLAMGLFAAKLDKGKAWVNWLEQSVNLVAQLSLLLAVFLISFDLGGYPAGEAAANALKNDAAVQITEEAGCVHFRGANAEDLLILYPGAQVDERAYAPLARMLAERGVDVCLVGMPLRFALLNEGAADAVLAAGGYERFWLGGHSLGGVVASAYAKEHEDRVSGLILLAAYPAEDLSTSGLSTLSLCGALDGVVDREKLQASKDALPGDTRFITLAGGNHAGFGDYGAQKGDLPAEMTAEAQWSAAADEIARFILNE